LGRVCQVVGISPSAPPWAAKIRRGARADTLTAMSTTALVRRWAWVAVLASGTALYLVLLELLVDSRDPSYVPAMVLLPGSIVPTTFRTLAGGRKGRWRVRAGVLAAAAFVGGVIGTVVAARLGFKSLLQLAAAPVAAVALIEEAAKLMVPAAATGLWH